MLFFSTFQQMPDFPKFEIKLRFRMRNSKLKIWQKFWIFWCVQKKKMFWCEYVQKWIHDLIWNENEPTTVPNSPECFDHWVLRKKDSLPKNLKIDQNLKFTEQNPKKKTPKFLNKNVHVKIGCTNLEQKFKNSEKKSEKISKSLK